MKKFISSFGPVVAAFLASLCCVGPPIFTALGIGAAATGFLAGTAQFTKALIPYRPFFIGLALLFLGAGFFAVYRKKEACAADSSCATKGSRSTKIVLWIVTGITLILIMIPYILAIGS